MFSRWNWVACGFCLVLSICSPDASSGLVQSCGHIIPESPVLALGSNFTALCILNESCLDFGNIYASQIIWKIKNRLVPKEQYREINRTVSSVTFNDTSSLATPLTCNILADGQIEQNIYGITVTVGLAPEKPKNLSCIVHQESKFTYAMTCTWNPGRHTFLDTQFRLRYRWPEQIFPDCIPKDVNNSCTIDDSQFFVNTEIWVEATNALGKAVSDPLIVDPIDIVKPLPPQNVSITPALLPTVLQLVWENWISDAVMTLKFNIRYRIVGDTNWMEVPPEDTASPRTSFSIQGLRPYTEYAFSIRCMKEDGVGYWSDWSEEKIGITIEDQPSKGPPIWRIIDTSQSPACWTVHLIWKALKPYEANGVILQYELTVRDKSSLSSPVKKYNVTSTNHTLQLREGTYEVTLIARNSVGPSPPSVLLIPASNSKGPTVQTKKVGKAEAVLTWNHLTVEEQNGFIRNYTILYKTIDGNETVVTVDPSKTEYTLSSLTSDTLYTVRMMASTDNGSRTGPDFTFTTQKFGKGEIEAIVVPVCLAFLLIVLLGVLFCFNKRDLIKKHIWPIVPDPSKSNIAQWSPQVPAKHNISSKDQMYPEGSFTDVSVVEIEADDKKSFSEQDLKPFDLLKKEKSTSEGHSSGIGGSSCMSSPRQSVSDSDEGETTQNTSSTVQYSTVVLNGYRDQTPVQVFSRSESTQPLLDSEERSEDHTGGADSTPQRQQYFRQNGGQDENSTDRPCFERTKQITHANEGDLVGFVQLQISGQSSQPLGLGMEKNTQEAAVSNVLQTFTEGQTVRPETVEENPLSVDEMPKSYLPQTVRQGGYMPQ
ncbi:interleukin-6 receptor subunit beta [Geospiza fortis]|uniref:Interleukin-6 receptor subunit beta n=1 Tax=Geospiza fortis TaxID=48883 RepID=A0A8N5EKH4_GEOFO|nr:interleukin-6 receptor subunit beta [Geospiza fortis]